MDRNYRPLKRILDLLFSALLLLFLSLPMLLIGVAVALSSKGGAIFRQERVGREGRIFVCYKFRTMYTDCPENIPTSEFSNAEKYVTPIGSFLRKTSLDELPQLYNVLKGDMSLVGPRPLIPHEGEIHELRRRCGVYRLRPGITGLAQINGRDEINDIDKARFDARYSRHVSLSEDARIIRQTLSEAFTGKNVAY